MKHKTILWIAVIAVGIPLLGACGLDSDDVATLNTDDAERVEAATDVEDEVLDEEAMMMAFTECLREQGVDVFDPVVDADGNVGKPQFPEGEDGKAGKAMTGAWEACEHHLEGFTSEQERKDMSEVVDQYVAFAMCMRDKGYGVDDPTAETLEQWDFKSTIDWNDPDARADYEECSGETLGEGSGK